MDKFEYQVIMDRINEIENEQLKCLDYICESLDYMIEVQKENVKERMLRLREEKIYFFNYLVNVKESL